MTSFPNNLVLDSQPRFGLTPSESLNLYNFLLNQRIFIVAKCSASVSLPDQVHVKVCNPIPLTSDLVDAPDDFRLQFGNFNAGKVSVGPGKKP